FPHKNAGKSRARSGAGMSTRLNPPRPSCKLPGLRVPGFRVRPRIPLELMAMKLRLSFAVLALSIASVLSAQDAATTADATAAPESAPAEAAAPAAPVDPMAAVNAAFAELAKA